MKKTFSIVTIICFILIPVHSRSQSPVALAVSVMGEGGKSLKNAYVKIISKDFKREIVRNDGRFIIHLPGKGVYEFWAGGVHHKSLTFPLLIETSEQLKINIQLAAAPYEENIDSVFVAGDFNNFSAQKGYIKMARLKNGEFQASVPVEADTLAYQLYGVQYAGHPIEGTQAHRYSYRILNHESTLGSSKFISVIKTNGKPAEIIFDPAQLPDSRNLATIQFNNPDSRTAKIATVAMDASVRDDLVYHAFIDHRMKGGFADEKQYDKSEANREYQYLIGNEKDPFVKQYLLLKYFGFMADEASLKVAEVFIREVPPSSPVWELERDSYAFNWVSKVLNYSEEVDEYLHQVINSQHNPTLVSSFLYLGLERVFLTGKQELFKVYYERLVNEFPESVDARNARNKYDPANKLNIGKPVPFFQINSMGNENMTYTPENMKGKVYLMDFWATWCAPCIKELPALHEVYQFFKEKDFTIISISADDRVEKVKKFRNQRWEMPWFHGMLTNGLTDPLAINFQVTSIPRAILVDERGNILANQTDIAKEGLMKILSRHFKSDKN